VIKLKRAYESASRDDGVRYLVERLWPRGVKKTDLKIDGWLKDVAPSAELRRWFSHDPAKWRTFQKRYSAELETKASAWAPILQAARRGAVTLIYSSHDAEHNAAVALRGYLEGKKVPKSEVSRVAGNTSGRGVRRGGQVPPAAANHL